PYQLLVIDTKYYVRTLGASLYGTARFRSDNLYQVYAYLRTQEQLSPSHRSASGMLLYPTTSCALNEGMVVQGHRIRVVTVNLNEAWERIEADLVSLVTSALLDLGLDNK